jgi:hypothetical protein
MKVFISWSGDLSKQLGESLRNWLPGVLQSVCPYFTPSDIEKGARWNSDIAKELEQAQIGILCVTKENVESPWLAFEAGALSKQLDKARVCPILFGLENKDIRGPLSQFQTTAFDKEEMGHLVTVINSHLDERKLAPDILDGVFEKWWPDLEAEVNDAFTRQSACADNPIRSERDILEEVLETTRLIAKHNGEAKTPFNGKAIMHLLRHFGKVHDLVRSHQVDDKIMEELQELKRSVEYIAANIDATDKDNIGLQLRELSKLLFVCEPHDDTPF